MIFVFVVLVKNTNIAMENRVKIKSASLSHIRREYSYILLLVLFIVLSMALSGCSVTGRAAEVDTAIIPFTDHKSCVKMCQDNFCEVSIEGQANCLQQGFSSCQKSCDLRFQR